MVMETMPAQTATNDNQLNGKQGTIEVDCIEKQKRKVSFVDEKLIMDALNSTMSNGKPNGPTSSSSFRYKPTNQEVRERQQQQQQNRANTNGGSNGTNGVKHHANGRGRPNGTPKGAPNQRYSNGGPPNDHSSKNFQKGTPNGVANKNAVIVYYNDPQAQINVDQLLTQQPPPQQQQAKTPNGDKQLHNHPANVLAPKATNGHQSPKQNGNHRKISNESATKYDDNWRQSPKPSSPKPNGYQKPLNGHNGTVSNGGAGGHTKVPPKSAQSRPRPNGKMNGSPISEKVTPKSEPITIYYSTPSSSEVIEQNLKELQLKTKANNSDKPEQNGHNDSSKEEQMETKSPQSECTTTPANANCEPQSSQVNVIAMDESPSNVSNVPCATIVNGGGSDEYDVISGGVPIEAPSLPQEGSKHPVLCMLVSHPQHFYIKFVNPQAEAQLAEMNKFYNSDEHIDLTVDVLKAGQYFAASRTRRSGADEASESKEWIRVQLLHVDSPEHINCLLIDEGCFGMFKLTDLQPLYNQFRSVPKQAIRASLAGVKPKESDWLPKQALDFKTLVSDKKFHTGEQKFDQASFDEKQSLELELYFTEESGEELKEKSVADITVERDIASKK